MLVVIALCLVALCMAHLRLAAAARAAAELAGEEAERRRGREEAESKTVGDETEALKAYPRRPPIGFIATPFATTA